MNTISIVAQAIRLFFDFASPFALFGIVRILISGRAYLKIFNVSRDPYDTDYYLYRYKPGAQNAIWNPLYWNLWTKDQWIHYCRARQAQMMFRLDSELTKVKNPREWL